MRLYLLASIHTLSLLLVDFRPAKLIADNHLFRKTRPHDLE